MPGYHFMNKKKIFLLIIILFIVFNYIATKNVLIIKEDKTGRIIWQHFIESPEKDFAIKYLHSVENTPVWEYFTIEQKQIILTGTEYESYGAGLPFLNNYNYTVADDKFIINGINRKLENIPLRVSDYAKHTFIFASNEYKLYQLTRPENLVIIKVVEMNNIKIWIEEVRQWWKKKN